jgi:hypothetical protein
LPKLKNHRPSHYEQIEIRIFEKMNYAFDSQSYQKLGFASILHDYEIGTNTLILVGCFENRTWITYQAFAIVICM